MTESKQLDLKIKVNRHRLLSLAINGLELAPFTTSYSIEHGAANAAILTITLYVGDAEEEYSAGDK